MPTAIGIRKIDGKPGQVYYPLERITLPAFNPSPTQVIVSISAAALNHRDLFIRQHLYPGTTFGVPLLADGCGTVTATGSSAQAKSWLGKRVVINPGSGWKDHPDGPESPTGYAILGGTKMNPAGTFADSMLFESEELELAPEHLSDVEAAALPLTGLTAWRAFFTKSGNAEKGRNVLVTGIGGGVALMALLFGVAQGCNVYVSSGSEEKLAKAKEMGAKGGINYKQKDWEKQLKALLPKDRPFLDAIVDGAGGDIAIKGMKILKAGGVLVSYGMTLGPQITVPMGAVLRNIDVKGSTMGSRKEFADMIKFTNDHKLKPIISKVAKGLDNFPAIEELYDDMKAGSQFGKLVIQIGQEGKGSKL